VDTFTETKKGKMMRIGATIHVERDSQKGMVIGRGGKKLKQIGLAAREDIEKLLYTKVYLELFVRVQKNWTRDTRALRNFGY
jgi:GTP-binding protein Era